MRGSNNYLSLLCQHSILNEELIHKHTMFTYVLVVSLTIYCPMWDLMGRDMRFMNLRNI